MAQSIKGAKAKEVKVSLWEEDDPGLKYKLTQDLLKTLVIAYSARTGAGLNVATITDHAQAAKAAIAEIFND